MFDVGNVLAHGGEARLGKARERWGAGFSNQDFRRMMLPDLGDGVDYWRRFQNGRIATDEYLSAAVRAGGLPDTREEREHFEACLKIMVGKPYRPTVRLAGRLKREYGLTIGVLTNNNEIMYGPGVSVIADRADVMLSSHHTHVSKPDPAAYSALLAALADFAEEEVRPESVVFVDDKARNIDAARALGITGFLFPSRTRPMDDSLRELLTLLAGFGITVDIASLMGAGF